MSNPNLIPHPHNPNNIAFAAKEEAELVLARAIEIINVYGAISLHDLHDLVGLPSVYSDNKWGWTSLSPEVGIKQVTKGYTIDFPPVETLTEVKNERTS